MTQYAGRFSPTLPRPYVTHEPSDGWPISVRPVWSSYIAGAWTVELHQQPCKYATSSTHSAKCGMRSLTHSPLLPCFLNGRVLGSRPESPLVNWLGNLPRLCGSGFPRHFASSGFGSNRSSGDGPPTMNMKMTLFALASKCGFLGARGFVDGVGEARASRSRSHDR